MLRAALYRPDSVEPQPADVQAAAQVRNACEAVPGSRRTFPSCHTCACQGDCIRLVMAGYAFVRPECNAALIELMQEKRPAALPARCLAWLQAHPAGASAAELSRDLEVFDSIKTSTALQRLCERGAAYCVGTRQSRRYYATEVTCSI